MVDRRAGKGRHSSRSYYADLMVALGPFLHHQRSRHARLQSVIMVASAGEEEEQEEEDGGAGFGTR